MNRAWRTAVVGLSDQVALNLHPTKSIEEAESGQLAASRLGTVAAGEITTAAGELITVASVYSVWERPVKETKSSWIYADASAHRLISDLSAFIGREAGHKVIVAGDWNILYGYGEKGSRYWKQRYGTVFSRMEAIGLKFVGPQFPDGGIRADPHPIELPADSNNVPTYRTKQHMPESAARQLDFVFASSALENRIQVRALNKAEEWGASDHCRVLIELSN